MKRKDFVAHLNKYGCVFVREGANHSIFFNPDTKRISTIPRHNELDNFLAKKICRDLGIESPRRKK
ncbi:MAG: type II toxin-antitoxin system HicA family toxin [Patescibacteria group bacterium]